MPARKALVIINTHARQGGLDERVIRKAFSAQGMGCTYLRLRKGQDASEEIVRHAKHHACVVVGGGDGTLNAAARGLVATQLPLGVLPLGTANDLARTLGLPTDIGEAAKVIAQGRLRAVDLGDVNGRLFFNVASIGFSAELARNLTRKAKKRWGVLGYALTAIKILWRNKPFGALLAYDGTRERVRTVQVAVGNGHYYGGGMKVAADAVPDDGLLDVYSLEVKHWVELLALVPLLKAGTHAAWPTVRGLRVEKLEIRTRKPMPVNADGEIVTHTPAVFTVNRAAVQVFVP